MSFIEKGIANGVASLDASGQVPLSQLGNAPGSGATRNNFLLVKSASDLTPYDNGTNYDIPANTTIELNGQIVIGTKWFSLGASCVIKGVDKSDDGLVYTGTGASIRSVNKDFTLKDFYIVANNASGSCYDFSGDNTNKAEISGMIFNLSTSIGTCTGGMDVLIFRNNLTINCGGGFTVTGTNDDVIVVDNIFKDASPGTNPTYLNFPSGTVSVALVRGNHAEVDTGEVFLNFDPSVTINNVLDIDINTVTGAGTGLTGVNANSPNVTIPLNSNQGIAGLFQGFLPLLLTTATTNSATQPSYASTGGTILLKTPSTYSTGATNLTVKVQASVTSSNGTPVYLHLYNRTTASFVTGANFTITPTAPNAVTVGEGPVLTLTSDTVYEVLFARESSGGNPSATIYNATFDLKSY